MKRNFWGALFFILLSLVSQLQAQQIPDTTTSDPDQYTCEVLYWDNMNMGFGHVALEVINHLPKQDDAFSANRHYLSFAMGNDYSTDYYKHGKAPERIRLPALSAENYAKFVKWYDEGPYAFQLGYIYMDSYAEKYSFLNNNCAHAALNGMKACGLPVKQKGGFGLRPKAVRDEAARISRLSKAKPK